MAVGAIRSSARTRPYAIAASLQITQAPWTSLAIREINYGVPVCGLSPARRARPVTSCPALPRF